MDKHVIRVEYQASAAGFHQATQQIAKDIALINSSLSTAKNITASITNGLNSQLTRNLAGLKGFNTQIVGLETQGTRLGKSIEANNLTLARQRDLLKEYRAGAVGARGAITELAKEQVRMQRSVVSAYEDSSGRRMARVITPSGLDMSQAKTQMSVASQELRVYNRLLQQNAEQIVNWGKNTQWAGRQIMVGLTIPIVMFGQAAKNTFLEVDQELTRMAKVYGANIGAASSNATDEIRNQVAGLGRQLAEEWGVSMKDVVGIAADIAATGKEGADLINATREAIRLSVLGEIDRQEAMKATLSLQSAFRLDTEKTTDAINFLNAVENQTSTSLADLVEAIPRTGPVIQALGGDVKDLALMMTAMREGGVDAAEAANAIKSGMSAMINPTKKATEVAANFGIDLNGIVQANKGKLIPMITALQTELAKLSDFESAQVVEEIFGRYQFARLTALFENLNRSGSQTQKVMELAGYSTEQLAQVAAKELTTLTESTSMKWKRTVETFKANLVPIGQVITEVFTAVLDKANKILELFNKLPDPVKKVAQGIIGVAALVGPLLMVAGIFGNFVGNIMKGLALLKGKRGGLFSMLTEDTVAATAASEAFSNAKYDEVAALQSVNSMLEKQLVLLKNLQSVAATGSEAAMNRLAADNGLIPFMPTGGNELVRAKESQLQKTTLAFNQGEATKYLDFLAPHMQKGTQATTAQGRVSDLLRQTITSQVVAFGDQASQIMAEALAPGAGAIDYQEMRRRFGAAAASSGLPKQLASQYADIVSYGFARMMGEIDPTAAGVQDKALGERLKGLSLGRGRVGGLYTAATAAYAAAGGQWSESAYGQAYDYGHGKIPFSEEERRIRYPNVGNERQTTPFGSLQESVENQLDKNRPRENASMRRDFLATRGATPAAWISAAMASESGMLDDLRTLIAQPKLAEFFRTSPEAQQALGSMVGFRSSQAAEMFPGIRPEDLAPSQRLDMYTAEKARIDESLEKALQMQGAAKEASLAGRAKIADTMLSRGAVANLGAEGAAAATAAGAQLGKSFSTFGDILNDAVSTGTLDSLKAYRTSLAEQLKSMKASGADPTARNKVTQAIRQLDQFLTGDISRSIESRIESLRPALQEEMKRLYKPSSATIGKATSAMDALFANTKVSEPTRKAVTGALGGRGIGEVLADTSMSPQQRSLAITNVTDVLRERMDRTGTKAGKEEIQRTITALEEVQKTMDNAIKRRGDIYREAQARVKAREARMADLEGQLALAQAGDDKDQISALKKKKKKNAKKLAAAQAEVDALSQVEPPPDKSRKQYRLGETARRSLGVGAVAGAAMGASMMMPQGQMQEFFSKWSMVLLGLTMVVPLLKGAGSTLLVAARSLLHSSTTAKIPELFALGKGKVGAGVAAIKNAQGVAGKLGVVTTGLGRMAAGIANFLGPVGMATVAVGALGALMWKLHNDAKKREERERRAGSVGASMLGVATTSFGSRMAGAPAGVTSEQATTIRSEMAENEEFKTMVQDAKDSGDAVGYLTSRFVAMNAAAGDDKELQKRIETIIRLALVQSEAVDTAKEANDIISEMNGKSLIGIDEDELKRAKGLREQMSGIAEMAKEKYNVDFNDPNYVAPLDNLEIYNAWAKFDSLRNQLKDLMGDWKALGTMMGEGLEIGSDGQALSFFLDQAVEVQKVGGMTSAEFEEWKIAISKTSPELAKVISDAKTFQDAVTKILLSLGMIPSEIVTRWTLVSQQTFADALTTFNAANTGLDSLEEELTLPEVDTTDVEKSYDNRIKAAEKAQKAREKQRKAEERAFEKTKKARQKEIDAIQETIDKIQEEADEKRKALEQAKDAQDFINDLRQADLDYYDAIARGDYAKAATLQNERASLIEQQAYDSASQELDDQTEKSVDAQQKKIDAIQAEVDKMQEAFDKKKEQWELEDERNQEALDALRENRDVAVEAERKKQEEARKTRDANLKTAKDSLDAMQTSFAEQAKAGTLSAQDIRDETTAAAKKIGEALGWSPAQVAAFADKMYQSLFNSYNGILNALGVTSDLKAKPMYWGDSNRPIKPAEISHDGTYVRPDHTTGRGGLGKDEVQRTLQVGEWVIRKEAVDKYGSPFFQNLNEMKVAPPKMHTGGAVANTATTNISSPTRGTGPWFKPLLAYGMAQMRDAAIEPITEHAAENVFKPHIQSLLAQQGAANAAAIGLDNIGTASKRAQEVIRIALADTVNEIGYCLRQVRQWWGAPGGVASAAASWTMAKKKHNDWSPKLGAPVYWTGGSQGYGHVALYVGNGMVRSTDAAGPGRVGTIPITKPGPGGWGLNYKGWTEDLNGMALPLRSGAHILKDDVLTKLHKKETVLTAPLSHELRSGLHNLNSFSVPAGEAGESGSVNYGDRTYNIVVNAAPGQSETAVANAVFGKIERKESRLGYK